MWFFRYCWSFIRFDRLWFYIRSFTSTECKGVSLSKYRIEICFYTSIIAILIQLYRSPTLFYGPSHEYFILLCRSSFDCSSSNFTVYISNMCENYCPIHIIIENAIFCLNVLGNNRFADPSSRFNCSFEIHFLSCQYGFSAFIIFTVIPVFENIVPKTCIRFSGILDPATVGYKLRIYAVISFISIRIPLIFGIAILIDAFRSIEGKFNDRFLFPYNSVD